MTNIKNNPLFNPSRKNEFLEDSIANKVITEETSKSYARIFGITANIESALDKDISEFSFEEVETVLRNFKSNNRNTIESYGRIISSYLNWCMDKGYVNKNVLKNLKPNDFENYLTNTEIYTPENKLRRYEDGCTNFQDAIILRLLFIGVGGKQMSEIRNLKVTDIDWDKKQLRLVNTLKYDKNGISEKFTERFLSFDDRTEYLLRGAIEQKTYTKRNGQMVEGADNVREFTDLVQNDYVVRASITKTENWNRPVDKFVIYRRISVISETLRIDDLTAKFIQRSGMIYFAKNLIQGHNKLSLDDMKIVADRFNMKSYHNLKGFLNIENIEKTYPTNDMKGAM